VRRGKAGGRTDTPVAVKKVRNELIGKGLRDCGRARLSAGASSLMVSGHTIVPPYIPLVRTLLPRQQVRQTCRA
jgi:hypothetical protein